MALDQHEGRTSPCLSLSGRTARAVDRRRVGLRHGIQYKGVRTSRQLFFMRIFQLEIFRWMLTHPAENPILLRMKRHQVIEAFGSQAEAARALGLSPSTIQDWEGPGVPDGRQYQIEIATRGRLKADLPADRRALLKVKKSGRSVKSVKSRAGLR